MVDLVIASYNTRRLLRECLKSIRLYTPSPFTITVVDNGSRDGTLAEMGGETGVYLVANKKNRGCAAAWNQGIHVGKEPYIIILNSDVEVTPGWLEPLIRVAGGDSRIAVVGNRHLAPDGTILHGGVFAGADGQMLIRGMGERGGYTDTIDCLSVLGACYLIKRGLLERLGLFDEGYFLYAEETDYTFRALSLGYRVVYCGQSNIIHQGGQSPMLPGLRSRYRRESFRRFYDKWGHHKVSGRWAP